MIFHRNYFVNTTDKIDVLSVVHEINRALRESKATKGFVIVTVPEAGGAVTIIELLPDAVEKLKDAISIFPGGDAQTKCRRKEEIMIGPRVAAAMLGKTITIPIDDGKLALAVREEPVLIDLETSSRRREFHVHIYGEGGEGGEEGDPRKRVPPQMKR